VRAHCRVGIMKVYLVVIYDDFQTPKPLISHSRADFIRISSQEVPAVGLLIVGVVFPGALDERRSAVAETFL